MTDPLSERQERWLKEMRKVGVILRIGRMFIVVIVLLSLSLPVMLPVFFKRPDLVWGSVEYCYSHPSFLKLLGIALIFIWFSKVNENYLKVIDRLTGKE